MKLIRIKFQKVKTIALILFIALMDGASLFADGEQPVAKNHEEPSSIVSPLLDTKMLLADKGVTLSFSYIGDTLANVSGGFRQGAAYKGSLLLGVNLDLEKLLAWKGGSFFTSILYPHGGSLTNSYVHDYNGVSNIDNYNNLRLYECWFQQTFANDKASLRIGKLAADLEFFVSDYSSVFINSAFGTPPIVGRQDFNAPFIPFTPPGIRLRVAATPSLTFLVGIFSGDTGQPDGNDKHGTRISFDGKDGALALFEADYRVNQQEKSEGLTGTYKLCGFCQTADFTKSNGIGSEHGDCGCCVIVDQQILATDKADKSKGMGLFSHISAAPADRNPVSFYLDGGLNYKGLIPARDKDVCAIGMGWTKISNELRDTSGLPVQAHHETIIEATYQAVINDWLSFQPDFQYIINPGATSSARNATVAGARFAVTF